MMDEKGEVTDCCCVDIPEMLLKFVHLIMEGSSVVCVLSVE